MKHSVKEYHLAGGASGLVIDVPGSNVASVQVRFNSGFQFGERQVYEVPHVMEHILATVTKKHPGPNEFNIEAQKNGAYINAYTSVDSNGYVYECADFELDRIVDLIEEQVTEPLFEPVSLKAEIGNVREELTRNTTQHGSICAIRLGEKSYPKLWMDYDERIAQLPAITVDHVRTHYERTHTASNARFFVAGSFNDGGEAIAKRFDQIFAKLPKGKRLVRSKAVGLNLDKPVVTNRDIKQLYYRAVMYFGEQSEAERRAATVLRMILLGGMGSRIYGEARRRGLAYSVGSAGHAEPGNSSFGFAGFVTPENAEPLFDLIAREFVDIRNGNITDEEMDASKDLMIGSVKRSVQTAGDVMGWYMDPYDEEGEIRDFDRAMELIRSVRNDEVLAIAVRASAFKRKGMSFLGQLDLKTAQTYAQSLQPLWD
jgi:predicted Zn-dependent peptidase